MLVLSMALYMGVPITHVMVKTEITERAMVRHSALSKKFLTLDFRVYTPADYISPLFVSRFLASHASTCTPCSAFMLAANWMYTVRRYLIRPAYQNGTPVTSTDTSLFVDAQRGSWFYFTPPPRLESSFRLSPTLKTWYKRKNQLDDTL